MLIVNSTGMVMGAAHGDGLASASPEARPVRPSGDAAALARRMDQSGVTRVAVTRPDGTLAGLLFAADVNSNTRAPRHRIRCAG